MARLSALALDLELCTSGSWHRYLDDAEVRIASFESPRYLEVLRRVQREKPEVAKEIEEAGNDGLKLRWALREVLAEAILVGWRKFENDDGSPIEYSIEESKKILSNPEHGPLLSFVFAKAGEIASFRRGARTAAAGN